MSGLHKRLSGSGAYRWTPCPGSIREQAPFPDTSSKHAKLGTAAHTLLEMCLRDGRQARSHLGLIIPVEGMEFTVDDDMADAVQVCLDYARGLCTPEAQTVLERQISLPHIHPDVGGTLDISVFSPLTKTITVVDYKHGQGKSVWPEWNPQLMIYGLGATHGLTLEQVDTVNLVIVQPRVFGEPAIREWSLPLKELRDWSVEVLLPAAQACDVPNAPVRPGDHCDFCKAKVNCPGIRAQVAEITRTDMLAPQVPAISQLTEEQIVRFAQAYAMFSRLSKDCLEYMGQQAMNRGAQYPGFKLVRKKSNRVWKAGGQQQMVALLGTDRGYKHSALTPSQAEKACKAAGLEPLALSDLWEKPEAGLTLVLDTDRRKAVAPPLISDVINNHPAFM